MASWGFLVHSPPQGAPTWSCLSDYVVPARYENRSGRQGHGTLVKGLRKQAWPRNIPDTQMQLLCSHHWWGKKIQNLMSLK